MLPPIGGRFVLKVHQILKEFNRKELYSSSISFIGTTVTTVTGELKVKDVVVELMSSSSPSLSVTIKPMKCSAIGIISGLYLISAAMMLLC